MENELFLESSIELKWQERFISNKEWIEKTAAEADNNGVLNDQLIDWLIQHGYHMLTLPVEHGGSGCNIKELIMIQSLLAFYDESTALSIGWHLGVVGEVFELKLWPEEMMLQFAHDIRNGAITNRIVSESEMGSPTRGGRPSTQAVRAGDKYVINGTKTFASMSHRLTHMLVGAYDTEASAMGFYYVPADSVGIEIVDTWDTLGMRATASHDVIFNDVKINERNRVEINKEKHANPWLMHIPAVYLGLAQRALDEAVKFSKTYQPNSLQTAISELPHIQDKLAKMEMLMMQSRHFIYHACDMHLEGKTEHLGLTFQLSKHIIVNNGLEIIDLAMRVLGAKSLERTRILERILRSMRAGLHNPPMDDAVERNIVTQLLKTHEINAH
ncbi:acyl-CoA dehydrogenase [Macrococcoides caseolyticum]|uniref:acyl-CoA dehydrogenase family protein n=1 Tax=Macrococcoides caseolyticum TaxID=69966 RepID=UPI000C3273FD|nr:acyl-CoA dehydrogenase family protein [Macrococcus caseolyticus]PKF29797.1 acyl-CoA dehydrogenase [Macrococcus caseolyticus]TDM15256.1 acyl-CoA dehydrogenase [Macrococcus caseolyticus]VUC66065.1 acyl-CoA dehydrogenase [Macrococcus caseolyticus]